MATKWREVMERGLSWWTQVLLNQCVDRIRVCNGIIDISSKVENYINVICTSIVRL